MQGQWLTASCRFPEPFRDLAKTRLCTYNNPHGIHLPSVRLSTVWATSQGLPELPLKWGEGGAGGTRNDALADGALIVVPDPKIRR
jgi:hypothetical protein